LSDSASPAPSSRFKWREISDLPDDLEMLRDRELESLSVVWTDQKKTIDDKRIEDFNAELAREWAIETGIIEGVYTLDRGITQTLIERGIDSAYIPHEATNLDPEVVARIIRGHEEALEGLFAFVNGERALTTGYIKELHSALLRHQATFVVFDQFDQAFEKQLEKGAYKKLPNNPTRKNGGIHEYCPPEHVASEMDRLIQLHEQHIQRSVLPHIEAAWLHHAFTQIHPFEDGNGRVARALASLIFIKRGFFPLVVNRDDRDKYIDVLELADQGDLSPLVRMFAQLQKRALTRAIGRAAEVKPVRTLEEALTVTRDLLVGTGQIIPTEYLKAKETAATLMRRTSNRLNILVGTLTNEVGSVNKDFKFAFASLGGPPKELAALAEKLHYDANANDYHSAFLGSLTARGVASRIVVDIHSVGTFRGLLAVVAYFQRGDEPAIPLSDDIFRISYEEQAAQIENRYTPWLEGCLIQGLAEWRRGLV